MTDIRYVDVDGHILEPVDLWLQYIEPAFRDRAMRVEADRAGLECWSVDRKPIAFFSGGTAADAASIGKSLEWRKENIFDNHRVGWAEGLAMNPPAWQPDRRAGMMDKEGIDISILYPSIGLTLPRIEDGELSAAHCRAYNNWIRDFCSQVPGRLFPAITLPWGDVQLTVQEIKRTSGFGARAVMAPNTPPGNMSYGRARWDPVWAEFVYQGIPVSLHVGNAGTTVGSILYPEFTQPSWWDFVTGPLDTILGFVSFFQGGVFDRFPELRLVVLEAGCAWMPWIVERMDEMQAVIGFTAESAMRPSEYFKTQCWISLEPNDEFGSFVIEHLGADRVVWAYDYPHSDSATEPIKHLTKLLESLSPEERCLVAGDNAIELYRLE